MHEAELIAKVWCRWFIKRTLTLYHHVTTTRVACILLSLRCMMIDDRSFFSVLFDKISKEMLIVCVCLYSRFISRYVRVCVCVRLIILVTDWHLSRVMDSFIVILNLAVILFAFAVTLLLVIKRFMFDILIFRLQLVVSFKTICTVYLVYIEQDESICFTHNLREKIMITSVRFGLWVAYFSVFWHSYW